MFGSTLVFIKDVSTTVARLPAFLYFRSLLLYYFLLIHRLFCLYAPWWLGGYGNEQCVEHNRFSGAREGDPSTVSR